jgi:hypothetical protein
VSGAAGGGGGGGAGSKTSTGASSSNNNNNNNSSSSKNNNNSLTDYGSSPVSEVKPTVTKTELGAGSRTNKDSFSIFGNSSSNNNTSSALCRTGIIDSSLIGGGGGVGGGLGVGVSEPSSINYTFNLTQVQLNAAAADAASPYGSHHPAVPAYPSHYMGGGDYAHGAASLGFHPPHSASSVFKSGSSVSNSRPRSKARSSTGQFRATINLIVC